jgi:hypothetical protein
LHEIFDPRFFHQTILFRVLIHGLKPFRIWLVFAEKIDYIRISAVSLTPLKWFPRCNWHRWNDRDGKVKNFIGSSTTEFFLPNFSGVNTTPLKLMWHRWNLKQTLRVLFLPLKGNPSKNISLANIPILYKYSKQEKVGGCLDLNFGFSGVIDMKSWNSAKQILYSS